MEPLKTGKEHEGLGGINPCLLCAGHANWTAEEGAGPWAFRGWSSGIGP